MEITRRLLSGCWGDGVVTAEGDGEAPGMGFGASSRALVVRPGSQDRAVTKKRRESTTIAPTIQTLASIRASAATGANWGVL